MPDPAQRISGIPDDQGSHQRVTVTGVPISGEAATGNRPVQLDVPAKWLDRLVVLACELPIAESEEAVARSVVAVVAELLPEWGVGACLVPTAESEARQLVIKVCPVGQEYRAGVDPTRLFPGFLNERVFDVEGNVPNASGTTLHLACDDAACNDARAPATHLMTRAASLLKRGLSLARTHAKANVAAGELRALTSHMVQAEKLASLGQIAAGVVHELNNPLTSIVAYTDYLARKGKSINADPDDMERLRRIGESAGRMLRFTRDLVTYARPSSETPVAVTIHVVIDRALAFCEHVLAEAGATVERHFAAEIEPVHGMPEQLAQVFVNLVTNACHAMPAEGGKLVITTAIVQGGTAVRVCVDDNGHGVAEANLANIFAPFFTTKGEGRGTGLGLSIVKNIIDKHAGHIAAERRGNGGTRFVLTLPIAPR